MGDKKFKLSIFRDKYRGKFDIHKHMDGLRRTGAKADLQIL